MKFLKWFNSLGSNMQFVFVFCFIGEAICLGMFIYSFVCIIREKLEEKRKRKERDRERYLRWLRESNSILFGLHRYNEQRPADWKPEKPKLFFDNPFSIPNEEKIPRWHNPNAESFFVNFADGTMQHNGKEFKLTPKISSCFCGGKGELVKYVKCEGKDGYPMSYIVCNSCGIRTGEYCAEEDNVVIDAWNKTMSGTHAGKDGIENDNNRT